MTTEEIKASLKRQRITRAELAEKLGVKKRTVDAWLSCGATIPFAKLQLIEQLLQPAPQAAPALPPLDLSSVKIINVRLTAEELDMCIRAARACRMELEDWARATILEAASSVLGTQSGAPPAASGKGGETPLTAIFTLNRNHPYP